MPKVSAGSNTYKSLQYCINQENFLRVFLSNGAVPMDNNVAERTIRPFTLGRKNWVNMDSIRGAQASAILYSLVETAKANNLRVYEYLEYLLDELSRHADDKDREFIKDLLPWSEAAQEKCRSLKNLNSNIKVQIYRNRLKMAISFILWYPWMRVYNQSLLHIHS